MKLLVSIGIAFVTMLSQAAFASEGDSKPNILLILCDDLGYGDVQSLNPEQGKILTPNIDSLAKQGMLFIDAHASSSVCTPSRYSLLTGRYSWRTRLQKGVLGGRSKPLIARERMTVASFLATQGYDTACIGKWHLGLEFGNQKFTSPLRDGPLQHGFDSFWGISASLDMDPFAWIENNHFPEVPSVTKVFMRSGLAAPGFEAIDVMPTITSKAVKYILDHDKTASSPFFLYLPLTAPHTPILPTPEWKGKSGLGDYADFVMQTDAAVGKVLQAIDDAGIRENTIVYFTSDNGFAPAANQDALQLRGHFPSANFRGYKSDIWEGGHRIPLIVRWPGIVAPKSRSTQLVSLMDFFATVADILAKELPENIAEDSYSLLPILRGDDCPIRNFDIYHSINGCFAVREGNWKLEFCPGSGGWGEPQDAKALSLHLPEIQLYNLASDPEESHNVESQYPEIVERLTHLLDEAIANGRTTRGPALKNDVKVKVVKSKQ